MYTVVNLTAKSIFLPSRRSTLFRLLLLTAVVGITCVGQLFAANFYVSFSSGDDANTGTSWAQAVKTLQWGVDLASAGDTLWVSNGLYSSGGKVASGKTLTNRVCIEKNLTMRSVNGPKVTIICGRYVSFGPDAVRCVYIGGSAGETEVTIDGFAFVNGTTHSISDEDAGGGVCSASIDTIITNCIFNGCRADYVGGGAATIASTYKEALWIYDSSFVNCQANRNGGGASIASLVHCELSGNSASENGGGSSLVHAYCCVYSNNHAGQFGGGANRSLAYNSLFVDNSAGEVGGALYDGSVYSCTLVENTAENGGGAAYASSRNSIVWSNSSPQLWNMDLIYYTCAPNQDLTNGVIGCVTNNPLFQDYAAGNFHLQSSSPCRNAGDSSFANTNYGDLDGQPRIVNSSLDLGAYERRTAFVPIILLFQDH